MQAEMTVDRYVDRRARVRVVNKAPYTVECKRCGRRWQPEIGEGGRVRRWALRCPNSKCTYHDD